MWHLLSDWFAWPDGSVLTNLVASAICVGLGVWRLLKSHRKLHSSLRELHQKHDRLHEQRSRKENDDA